MQGSHFTLEGSRCYSLFLAKGSDKCWRYDWWFSKLMGALQEFLIKLWLFSRVKIPKYNLFDIVNLFFLLYNLFIEIFEFLN